MYGGFFILRTVSLTILAEPEHIISKRSGNYKSISQSHFGIFDMKNND